MRNIVLIALLCLLTACVSAPQYRTVQTFTGPVRVPVESSTPQRVTGGVSGDTDSLGGWMNIILGNNCYLIPRVSVGDGKPRKRVNIQC